MIFQAYTNWLKTLPEDDHQPRLPGLSELSDHHLFFLNFAQVRKIYVSIKLKLV